MFTNILTKNKLIFLCILIIFMVIVKFQYDTQSQENKSNIVVTDAESIINADDQDFENVKTPVEKYIYTINVVLDDLYGEDVSVVSKDNLITIELNTLLKDEDVKELKLMLSSFVSTQIYNSIEVFTVEVITPDDNYTLEISNSPAEGTGDLTFPQ